MSRLHVRAAEYFIDHNEPSLDGFLIEAKQAFLVVLQEREKQNVRRNLSKATYLPARAWGVYRLVGPEGRTLYVGMTGKPKARVRQHLREFGDRIEWVDFQRFGSRVEAYDAETAMIRHLRPPWNVAKVPG